MTWLAIIAAFIQLGIEVLKLILDVRADKKKEKEDEKKERTMLIQRGVRGVVDHDESRYLDAIDRLRSYRRK